MSKELKSAHEPCSWSDAQVLEFLGVALRNVDIVGSVRLSEIRQGFEYMRKLYAAPVVSDKYTYSSKQETECAGCGVRKHTPLRVDEMGGYVCLTCIDAKLTEFYDAPVVSAEQQGVTDGWIPVSERMPEPGEPVQVWCSGADQAGLAWVSRHADWSGEWVIPEPQAIGYESITHWMPLPSAPAPSTTEGQGDE